MPPILLGLALAAAEAPAAPPVTAAEQAAIDQAEARGKLIFAYDRAAWLGTDDLKAKLPDFATKVGGWIVDGPVEAPELVFFDRDAANPHAIYIADFRAFRLTASHLVAPGEPATLNPPRRALIAARATAIAAFAAARPGMCAAAAPNTVVLPPEGAGPTHVYIMSPQTDINLYPVGGHYLIDVDAAGHAGPLQPFTRSCINATARGGGHEATVMVVSDVLHATPTEIHVFTSYAAHKPLAVVTAQSHRAWLIVGPQVRPLALPAS